MEYQSERKLVEMENEQGYWARGTKVWGVTGSHHVDFMMEHPDYFDTTTKEILDRFRANNETLEHDKITREQLIFIACKQGWIRIRHYLAQQNFWSIQCDRIRLRERTIRDFIEDFALKNKLMKYDDKLVIIGLDSDDEMDIYKPEEGGVAAFLKKVGMEENSEVKLDDLLKEYK
jgi:hypothetical protein